MSGAAETLRRQSMFNAIDLRTGWKVDLILPKRDAFAQSQFDRRIETELLGTRVFVASAEDTVLSKLAWAKAGGGSERQLRDVAGIVTAAGRSLDEAYIERWAAELGVEDLWRRARSA